MVFRAWKTSDVLQQDVRFAIRSLRKRPGFTMATITMLALGIGANVAMFSAFHQALLRPLPFAEPESLVLGRAAFNGYLNPDMSAYDFFDYRERNEVFESVGTIKTMPANVTITGGDEPEQVSSVFVSWDLFPTLGIPAAIGRHFLRAEEELGGPKVAMLSGGYWLRRFGGSPDVIGSTILIDGTAQTIVGVMPPDFRFMHDADLWVPMRRDGPKASSRGWHSWFMVGRLRSGVTIESAQADVDVISAQLATEYPDTNRDKALQLTKLHAAVAENYQTAVILLMAAVGLVLLIACGNVASLLLARGATRRAELCVRSALGASSPRLVRQLLTESIVTSTAGGACGTALAIWFQKFILHVVPVNVPGMEDLGVSWSMLAFALAVSTVSGIIFGIMPALQAARVNVADTIKSGTRTTDTRGQGFHSSLVVAQVAISVILLVGSGLLLKSFATLSAVKPGFDTQNLLTAEIRLASDKYPNEAMRIEFFSRLTEELRAIPGVTDVAVINQLPIRNPGNNPRVYAADRPPPDPNDRIGAYTRTVLPGYFDAMGIPLLHGRVIDASDIAQAPRALVINETMARKLFPNEDPLGRLVNIRKGVDCEVVGVVGDVRVEGLRYTPRLVMYGSYFQQPTLTMRIAIRTAFEPTSLAEAVRNAVWDQDRDVPVAGLLSYDEIIARTVSNDKVIALSVSLFASVAVLLAALGLYGVLAYYISRRTHEIGICIALGAEAGDVIRPILRRGISLVVTGIALGLVGAFWVTRLFQQLLFDVATTDATTFVVVSVFFVVVALVACLIAARKALQVDPVTALAAQ
jgi:putative ABC transport system permease protein